jgi:hypothetical protein
MPNGNTTQTATLVPSSGGALPPVGVSPHHAATAIPLTRNAVNTPTPKQLKKIATFFSTLNSWEQHHNASMNVTMLTLTTQQPKMDPGLDGKLVRKEIQIPNLSRPLTFGLLSATEGQNLPTRKLLTTIWRLATQIQATRRYRRTTSPAHHTQKQEAKGPNRTSNRTFLIVHTGGTWAPLVWEKLSLTSKLDLAEALLNPPIITYTSGKPLTILPPGRNARTSYAEMIVPSYSQPTKAPPWQGTTFEGATHPKRAILRSKKLLHFRVAHLTNNIHLLSSNPTPHPTPRPQSSNPRTYQHRRKS